MPCAATPLNEEVGIPVVCETDIHGAITALMVEAASRNDKRSFFADWTVRHPDNENGELLQHCDFVANLSSMGKPTIGYPLAFSHPGAEAQGKLGEMTLARLTETTESTPIEMQRCQGPYTKGTYVWVEVQKPETPRGKNRGRTVHHHWYRCPQRTLCRFCMKHANTSALPRIYMIRLRKMSKHI